MQQQLALLNIHRTTRSIKRYLDEVIVDVFNVECDSMSLPMFIGKPRNNYGSLISRICSIGN
ncbi:hypothetical protein VCRA2123E76_70029 [Vibrio crassostreae]|nr:hypothetical protein VCRA2123E76_70029 [Vibrio crassostreae]